MSDRLVDRVLNTVSLLSYLEDEVGVRIKPGSADRTQLTATCFNGSAHARGDKNPSMRIHPHKGVYHCKGCGIAGNVIDAYAFVNNLTQLEAKLDLARRHNLLEERPLDRSQSLLGWAASRFVWNLKNLKGVEAAVKYLTVDRGLTWETIERFELGYCWGNEFSDADAEREVDALEAGLVWPRRTDGEGNSRPLRAQMNGRITFPIKDREGRVVGFGGRVVPGGYGGDGPKYLNTGETKHFKKSEVLYGANLASASVARMGYAVLVEGYMDVVGLHQAKVTNAMAILGAGANDKAFERLWRMTRRVVFALDPDQAGRDGVIRTIKATAATMPDGGEIAVMEVPDGLDPDEYVLAHGGDAFTKLCDEAQPLSQFLVGLVASEYNQYEAEQRARFLIAVQELSALFTKAPTVREQIVDESKAIANAAVIDASLNFAGMGHIAQAAELEAAIAMLQQRLELMRLPRGKRQESSASSGQSEPDGAQESQQSALQDHAMANRPTSPMMR